MNRNRLALSMKRLGAIGVLGAGLAGALNPGCEAYDGVPYASIVGAENGVLPDRKLPLVLEFTKPVDVATVKLKVARYTVDAEGFLADEDADTETELEPIVDFDGSKPDDAVGTVTVSEDKRRLTIAPPTSFPVAEKLVILLEPGLSDGEGHTYITREKLPFSYDVKLNCTPTKFPSGAYFFLANVTKPIGVQVQLLAWLEVDEATGKFIGRFVNADRNKDPAKCEAAGLMCTDKEACRTLPEPACVAPSEKAASVDEYPDYYPNYVPPVGYAFDVSGCVDGSGGDGIVFTNLPVDVEVLSPHVTLIATLMTATFAEDASGVMRGSGAIATDAVLLGTADSGAAEGTISARILPDIPKDLQKPEGSP